MENSMGVPQKTKYGTTMWSSDPTPGHTFIQNCNSKRYIHFYVHSSTIHRSQYMETTKMSINRLLDKKMWHMCTMEYYSVMKNNGICSNMDATRDSHTKWSKSERKTSYTMWYHLCVESKIWHKWTFLQNRNRITDIENRPVVAKVEVWNGQGVWGW